MSLVADRSLREAEAAFLETLRPEYEDRGYKFVPHPSRSELPEFLATYQPDAIAKGPNHSVAIEVKSQATPSSQQSIQKIRQLFEGRPDWHFRVAYMGGGSVGLKRLPVPSRTVVLQEVQTAEQLVAGGSVRAAFIVAWSLLEAAYNSVRPEADKRPRTPGTVVQALAMDGLISDELERSLRSLIELRNRVVHGDLTVEPNETDVNIILSAVKAIVG